MIHVGVQYQGDAGGPKRFARRAEQAGFDSVWCGDHVGHLQDGLATLGVLAGATEHITVGLNLLVVPYRPAAIVAKGIATVCSVAPGRVIAGFGVGGEFPAEFAATGADPRERGRYTDDALDVVARLWSGEPLVHHSPWASFDGFVLEPPPSPVPPVWIGGRSDAALRRAVRVGDGYVPYLVSPEELTRRRTKLAGFAAEAGRSLDGFAVGCLVTTIPASDVEAGVQRGLRELKLSGLTPEGVRARYLVGDDDALLGRCAEYVAAGVTHLILGCLPGDDAQVDEFFATASRLLPALRELS